ncbi:MAG: helicase-exonuclease AddAB subunit AddA [Lachnospiraceae bacterium]|nr:helicase-exonuclease AddAB subunit AddA [Lachnospiraceae bacterium]
MAVSWTEEQKKVIYTRDRDILVSAAAGSGKTAVLVERIVQRITDPSDPVSVTSLLVVTFTRAAAAEMKERLNDALAKRMEKDPENPLLAKQAALLPQAQICTIDSFCQWLVKQYFFLLDIDPDFRIADQGEDLLLKEDCLDRALSEAYEKNDNDFRQLMDCMSKDMNDRAVRDMILDIFDTCESMPWPERTLEALMQEYDGSVRDLAGQSWFLSWGQSTRIGLMSFADSLKMAAAESSEYPELEKYTDMFLSDLGMVNDILASESFGEMYEKLAHLSFARKPGIRKLGNTDPAVKEKLSAWRDAVKDGLKALFPGGSGDIRLEAELAARTDPVRREIIGLTLRFGEIYAAEKRKRDLATFSDIEHLALRLLWRWEEDELVPTELQQELKGLFREVMTDEYQDSNLVQEEILRAFGKNGGPGADRFMVGDVKQSIYRFRMARPEIFMEKYRTYSPDQDAGSGYRIDLGKNFRSRNSVLAGVNHIFSQVMTEELGGIPYDDAACLKYGAGYELEDPETELLICDHSPGGTEGIEAEAGMIADKIRELMDPAAGLKLWDAKENRERPVCYRDIVILVRSAESMAEPLRRVLMSRGIPAHAQENKGYFSAPEVQILLSFLKIIDDPLQDIPLAAVLLSPIGGFTKEELASMCAGVPAGYLFDKLAAAAQDGRGTEKFIAFRDMLTEYRRLSAIRPIHEILIRLLDETGYLYVLAAEPGGAVRKANVEMLIEKAASFEETSYRGIFRFLRYIERLHDYKVDEGEASALSENEDLVRITTIHKSKGMEYPVVFVAGTGRSFNLQDAQASMLLHQDRGIACDLIDPKRRTKTPLLYKKLTAEQIKKESREEELRILYVAMTRAKEKLILTANTDDLEKKQKAFTLQGIPPVRQAGKANSYLAWLLMTMEGSPIRMTVKEADEEAAMGGYDAALAGLRADRWRIAAEAGTADRAILEKLESLITFAYPFADTVYQKGVASVSELKKAAAQKAETEPAGWQKAGETDLAPDGSGTYPASGAARGTAYHLAMRWLSPEECKDAEAVHAGLERLVREDRLSQEEMEMIAPGKISRFYASRLGRIAAEASASGKLYCEKQFISRLPLSAYRQIRETGQYEKAHEEGEWMILQGITDAYAVTEDGIILWDYKTDSVPGTGGEQKLMELYGIQMKLYAEALSAALGKPVREVYLYSFALEKAIVVSD